MRSLKTEDRNGLRALIDELYARTRPGGGGLEASAFVPVTAFGAIGDGVHDDTPNIQNGINLTALTGKTLWFPPAPVAWTINAPVVEPNGTQVWCDPEALFDVNVAGASASDSAFVTRVPVAVGAPTTLAATPTQGSTTFDLASVAGVTKGSIIRVSSATFGLLHYYIVEAPPSGSDVTVDRAIVWPWASGDTVQVVDQLPPTIHWYGNGCRMTGTCVLFFFGAAWNSAICGIRFSGIVGGAADAVAGFHNGSLNVELAGCWADATGVIPTFNAGFGVVGGERWTVTGNVMLNGGPECSLFKMDDARYGVLEDNLGSGGLFGISLGSDGAVTTAAANQFCVVRGNKMAQCSSALQVTFGSSDVHFEGNTWAFGTSNANPLINIIKGGAADLSRLVFVGDTITGGAQNGIEVSTGVHALEFHGCKLSSNAGIDFESASPFTWVGGSVQSTGNDSFHLIGSATTQAFIRGAYINNTTTAAAATAVLNDGGRLSVTGCRIELGHANDVGVWSNGAGATAVTYVDDTLVTAVGGVGGTFGMVAVAGQTVRMGPNVNLAGVATPIDVAGGGFYNRGTFNSSNGVTAVAFPDLQASDQVILTPTGAAPTGFLSSSTPGTGFDWTDTGVHPIAYLIL